MSAVSQSNKDVPLPVAQSASSPVNGSARRNIAATITTSGSKSLISPCNSLVILSMTRVSSRKISTPSPCANPRTGNRNQSFLNSSEKKSISITRNNPAHSCRISQNTSTNSAASASTKKFRHEYVNRTWYDIGKCAARCCRYISALKHAIAILKPKAADKLNTGNSPNGSACQPV